MSEPIQNASISILEPVKTPEPWQAYRLPVSSYPLSVERRAPHRSLVEALATSLARTMQVSPSCWIDSQPMHHDGGAKIFSAHSRLWSSEMGFCFDPAGEPPRKMQLSDLMDADFGTAPKLYDRTAIHVAALAQSLHAYRLLAGRGIATLLFFAGIGPDDPALAAELERFKQHTREHLRPLMSPGEFQTYRFYVPLLSSSAVAGATAQQLTQWTGNAIACLHESFDAKELVLLSAKNLDATLQSAGLERMSVAENAPWSFQSEVHEEVTG